MYSNDILAELNDILRYGQMSMTHRQLQLGISHSSTQSTTKPYTFSYIFKCPDNVISLNQVSFHKTKNINYDNNATSTLKILVNTQVVHSNFFNPEKKHSIILEKLDGINNIYDCKPKILPKQNH